MKGFKIDENYFDSTLKYIRKGHVEYPDLVQADHQIDVIQELEKQFKNTPKLVKINPIIDYKAIIEEIPNTGVSAAAM
tara:strand:- start:61 stop:294 length:234 start_codon:yes stop_codon:yes gene_type:complete